jgi:lipopolysaccharide biosynthesis glycosyltransferase
MVVSPTYNTVTKGITVTATSGGASSNVVYTCPLHFDAEIDFLHITNGATANHNVSVQWYHAESDTYHHILNDKAIAGKDVYNIITSDRIHLHAGDKITAFNGVSGSLEVFLSGKEFYNPNR